MEKYGGTKVTISLVRSPRQVDDIPVNSHEAYTLDLSGVREIGRSEIAKALADNEYLDSILRDHPTEVAEIMDDILVGRSQSARGKGKKIGLEEEKFRGRSGGAVWWVVAAIVVALIVCCPEKAY